MVLRLETARLQHPVHVEECLEGVIHLAGCPVTGLTRDAPSEAALQVGWNNGFVLRGAVVAGLVLVGVVLWSRLGT